MCVRYLLSIIGKSAYDLMYIQNAEACSDWALAMQDLIRDEKEMAIENGRHMYVPSLCLLRRFLTQY